MASTTFIDKVTVVEAPWLNEVNGTVWTLFNAADTPSLGRTALGLGSIATQNSNNVSITGGTITGIPITSFSGTLPVASGGTGVTTSTGTGNVVLSTSPALTTPTLSAATLTGILTVSGTISGSTSTGGDFVLFQSTAVGSEVGVRVDASSNTSGVALRLSNSGLNVQSTVRGTSTGGLTFYTGQTAGASSTSGTQAVDIASTGALNARVQLQENGVRVWSRGNMFSGSGVFTTTKNSTTTQAHGLGARPSAIDAKLVCITGELGYTAGDELPIWQTINTTTGTTVAIRADATNIYIRVVSSTGNELTIPALSSNALVAITPANWAIVVKAWY